MAHTGTNPVVTRACPDCDRPHGKPLVPDTGLHVSVSHSGDLVAVAVTTAAPVGIDVELGSDLGWCRWESVVKATGDGMRVPLFPVSDPVSYRGAPLAATVRDLELGPDHVGAVTVLARGPLDVEVISCGSR
jgi:4'-phosphopantetheinyl transferase